MNEFFSTLSWRDSALLELSVGRDDQGRIEEVRLRVRWPEGGEGTVRFRDCSHVGELEPAYVDERVLAADVEDGWAQTGVQEELSRQRTGHLPLHFYRFRTSARADAIEIYASRLEILA